MDWTKVKSATEIGAIIALILDWKQTLKIARGFGTSPSIVASNGTATITVNVGTGGTAVFGIVDLAAAPNGWSCAVTADQLEVNSANYPRASFTSTSQIGINNIVTSTGAQTPWPSGDTFTVNCIPY